MLKVVNKNNLANDFNLLESIKKSEDQISKGQSVKANTSMSDEEIDDLLTK